jgi:hypothetical protein
MEVCKYLVVMNSGDGGRGIREKRNKDSKCGMLNPRE